MQGSQALPRFHVTSQYEGKQTEQSNVLARPRAEKADFLVAELQPQTSWLALACLGLQQRFKHVSAVRNEK